MPFKSFDHHSFICYGDAQHIITHLLQLKDEDPGWIINTRLDPCDNRLTGLFWMSPTQQQCLIRYNDIVQTDNTCRTNWFDMYLTLLVVVDNNTKTRLVAQSLSEDETTESYNIPPVTIFSDADPALGSAIALKMPTTHHFSCIFHIQENIRKNLRSKLGNQYNEFYKEFLHTRNSTFEDDFYRRWARLLDKYPQTQDYFNRTLQNCIRSWARCYQLKCFTAGIQSTQRVEVMNRLIKEGVKSTSSLCNLHEHIQKLLDNEAKWARHNNYLNALPTNQAPSIVESIFPKVLEILKSYLTPHIFSVQHQQITGSLLYQAHVQPKELFQSLQDNLQLDYNNGFLEDQLDRPQISIMALLKDMRLDDVLEIWEITGLAVSYKHYVLLLSDGGHLCTCMAIINRGIVCAHFFQVMMNTKMEKFHIGLIASRWYQEEKQDQDLSVILQQQAIEISTKFQQKSGNITVPDLHIMSEIRDSRLYTPEIRQIVNKKARYANGSGKMKKALNIALDLGCEEELIIIVIGFIEQKKSVLESVNNGDTQSEQRTVKDPLVSKHRGRPPIKRLKGSSENQGHKAFNNHAINPRDPNLFIHTEIGQISGRTALSNVNISESNNQMMDKDLDESNNDSKKKKYVCKVCGETGHNARNKSKCKQQE